MKRNFLHPGFDKTIDEMIGSPVWRQDVHSAEEVPKLIDHLRNQLSQLGYSSTRERTLTVTNTKNAILYHLVFASKNERGTSIWRSITKHDGAQQGLF